MSFLYEKGFERFLGVSSGQTNWDNDVVHVIFLSSSYTPDPHHSLVSSISAHTGTMVGHVVTAKGSFRGIASGSNIFVSDLRSTSVYPYILIYITGSSYPAAQAPLVALLDSGSCTGLPVSGSTTKTITWSTVLEDRIFHLSGKFGIASFT